MEQPSSSSSSESGPTRKVARFGRVFVRDLFKDEVAIVTGGGTGIGREIAREMAFLGAKVAICGRRVEPIEETANELKRDLKSAHDARNRKRVQNKLAELPDETQKQVHFETCDIRNYESVKSFVEKTASLLGPISILVNCAGGFNSVVQNNLIGTWNMTHACAVTSMIPNKRGRVVNITAQIKRGFPGMVHTGAARAGVENMTKTLAVEWSPYNILVNCVAPGVITPDNSGTHRYPKEVLEKTKEKTPLRRQGLSSEVAHLVTFLCSPMAGFITGQSYYIDGGQSLWGDFSDPHEAAKL